MAALGLQAQVQQAEQLTSSSPAQAAAIYQQVAGALTDRYPAHAARFQQRRAAALRSAGDPASSHDILMSLAVAELAEAAEPQVSSAVAHALTDLHDDVDPLRQARGAAVIRFGRWHERSAELITLAECFDAIGPDDEYGAFIAVLVGVRTATAITLRSTWPRCGWCVVSGILRCRSMTCETSRGSLTTRPVVTYARR